MVISFIIRWTIIIIFSLFILFYFHFTNNNDNIFHIDDFFCFFFLHFFSNEHTFFVKHSLSIHSSILQLFVLFILIVRLKRVNSKVRDDVHETIATHQQHRHDRIEVAAPVTVCPIRQIIMVMESIAFHQHY